MKKVIIIGSGFSSLSAACYMAQKGHEVTIYEKNSTIGGRARQIKEQGFTFDTGPTFYWMPDVFENFFDDFSKSPSDYYELIRLDPSYEIYFERNKSIKLSSDFNKVAHVFESNEMGSSIFLKKFMRKSEFNYRVAIDKIVYKPGLSPLELIIPQTIKSLPQFVHSLSHTVRSNIKNPKLQQILEFPVLFLGAKPSDIPSFYRFMNFADMKLGTWHIRGGMYELVKAIQQLAFSLGVKIITNSNVEKIVVEADIAKGVLMKDELILADVIISGADYHHTESLLDISKRNYSEKYWNNRVFAPSALLYYVGFDRKLDNISHHTLFFDTDFDKHAKNIFDTPVWPDKPLFYASFSSKTDPTIAPEGKEGGIILIPVAPGLHDTESVREKYFFQVIERMENITQQNLKQHIIFHKSYAVSDFIKDYNAYKGNAYGLANILSQTAFLKPKIFNKKVKNLFYAGQLTVPGPGVPTTIISGKIAANMALSYLQKIK